jgi:hypothetical protein
MKITLLGDHNRPTVDMTVIGIDVREHGMTLVFENVEACAAIFPGTKNAFIELFWDYQRGGVLFKGIRYPNWSVTQ